MELNGKRVLVVGAARSGVAAARFLLQRGARVTLTDSQPAEKLPEARVLGVPLEAGGHVRQTFTEQDLVVISPGVPAGIPELAAARGAGVPVIGEVELAARFLRGRIVGITGSNGKTTVTALAGKILEAAGFHTLIGGNIGTPLISQVAASRPETIHVVELSSFQLETICELRPAVAVVLNVTPDHLDRYTSFDEYAAAKARIFMNQTPGDFAVLNADDAICRRFAGGVRSQVYWFSRLQTVDAGAFAENGDVLYRAGGWPARTVLGIEEISLKGLHNLENVLAAVCTALLLEADATRVRAGVRAFRAVEHRLEYVSTIDGVEFYNDSKATNVDAALKALEAFSGLGRGNRLLVILGGKDKGGDYRVLRELLEQRARAVLLIGAAANKIAAQLEGLATVQAGTLENAVDEAARRARPGDVVLLAPACASFDQFENYEHRGRVFKELVAKLEGRRGGGR